METVTERPSQRKLSADPQEVAWFESPPPSSVRRPSSIPPPLEPVGEFLGDPLADSWLR
jgi:hypothetical protein